MGIHMREIFMLSVRGCLYRSEFSQCTSRNKECYPQQSLAKKKWGRYATYIVIMAIYAKLSGGTACPF